MGARLLVLGAGLSALVALLHLGIAVTGRGYRYFGGPRLGALAESGSPLPVLMTLGVAGVFGGFAAYALAGAGTLPRLPLLRLVLVLIAALYTLRGLQFVPQLIATLLRPGAIPLRLTLFSGVSLTIGLIHAVGLRLSWSLLRDGI